MRACIIVSMLSSSYALSLRIAQHQKLDLKSHKSEATAEMTAWAQGGGGCLSMLSQAGFARGYLHSKDAPTKAPIAHTTSSGGSWMWTTSLGWMGQPGHNASRVYGEPVWSMVTKPGSKYYQNSFAALKRIFKSSGCTVGPHDKWWGTCKPGSAMYLFGASHVCSGPDIRGMEISARTTTELGKAAIKFGTWTDNFKDFLWKEYLRPNGIPRNATFKWFDRVHDKDLLQNWIVHATQYSYVDKAIRWGTYEFEALKGSNYSDIEVLEAVGASSEAFWTFPTAAKLFHPTWLCNPFAPMYKGGYNPTLPAHPASDLPASQKNAVTATSFKEEKNMKEKRELRTWERLLLSTSGLMTLGAVVNPFTEASKIAKNSVLNPMNFFYVGDNPLTPVGDGAGSDNQALAPLIRQIETFVPLEQRPYVFPAVLMTPVDDNIVLQNFVHVDQDTLGKSTWYQAMQYFMPEIPAIYAVPYSMGEGGDFPFGPNCLAPKFMKQFAWPGDKTMVKNPLYVLKIPDGYWGGEECKQYAYLPNNPPLKECKNLWSMSHGFGILYFEDVEVVPNSRFSIAGGWTFRAIAITTQMRTDLSKRWLETVDREFARSKSQFAELFPNYAKVQDLPGMNTLTFNPVYPSYLLTTYMEYLSYVQGCCLATKATRNKDGRCPWCNTNTDLCPCERLHAVLGREPKYDYVFPVQVNIHS